MGQFSFLDCVDGRQIIDTNVRECLPEESYLLIPKEFGGGKIAEPFYDGYGHFGCKDILDLIATWNRKWASENPGFVTYCHSRPLSEEPWYPYYADLSLSEEEVLKKWSENEGGRGCFEWREIGNILSSYDEDLVMLAYPPKITYDPRWSYEDCIMSLRDPDQGWKRDPWEDWRGDFPITKELLMKAVDNEWVYFVLENEEEESAVFGEQKVFFPRHGERDTTPATDPDAVSVEEFIDALYDAMYSLYDYYDGVCKVKYIASYLAGCKER